MMKKQQQGLVADLYPNIRVMKMFGHFVFNYYDDNSSKYLHKVYCCVSILCILACLRINAFTKFHSRLNSKIIEIFNLQI